MKESIAIFFIIGCQIRKNAKKGRFFTSAKIMHVLYYKKAKFVFFVRTRTGNWQ